jgi:hypothetical protein
MAGSRGSTVTVPYFDGRTAACLCYLGRKIDDDVGRKKYLRQKKLLHSLAIGGDIMPYFMIVSAKGVARGTILNPLTLLIR